MAPPEEASDHEEENYPTFPPDEEENQDCNQALALEDSNQTLALEEDNHQTANNQEDDSSSSAVPLSIAPPPTTAHRTPTVSTRDFMQELELALRRRRQRIQDAEYGGPSDPQRSTEEQHDNKHDGTNEGMTGGQDNLMTTTARISQWTSMRLHQGGSFKRGTEGGSSTMETQEKVRTGENEQVDEESRWRHPYLAHLEECPTPAYQSSAASGTPTPVTPPIRTVRDVMRDLSEAKQVLEPNSGGGDRGTLRTCKGLFFKPVLQGLRGRHPALQWMDNLTNSSSPLPEIQRKVKRQLTEPSTNPTGRDPRHPRAPYTLLGDIIPNGRQLVRPPAPVSSTSPSSTPESQHSSRRISLPQLLFGIGGHGMTRRRRNSNERRTRRMRWRNGRQADRGRTGEETAVVTESASQTTDQSQTASSSYWFWLPIPDWFRLRFRGSGGREVSSSDSQLNRGDVQGTGDHQTTNEDEETPREGSNTPTDSSNHTDH
ncbi:unnamed protein product [Cyprideis torosa]|uniref:Uncharacterized protein n=1 Tax=Cyprideis torosa TaxID=163714 RepID=A0A7R8W622_9CRUS|nr:unnamed protein product [Cyprideis torosa]CAG0886015.1 unnamed protein product [Cyprideis torosa]